MLWTRRRALLGLGSSLGVAAFGAGGCRPAADTGDQDTGDQDTASLWFSYGGKNREVLLDLVSQFHRRHPEHRVHPVYQGDYFEGLAKLRTAWFAGAPPALTHVIGEVVPYLAEAGVLETLDPSFEAGALGLDPRLSQEGTWSDGATRPLVALPFNRSTPIAYCNAHLFEERGLRPPGTWDELRETARALTDRAGDTVRRWGFQVPVDWWFWTTLLGQAGGALLGQRGEVTLGGAAGVEALQLLQTLVHEDRSMKPPPGRDYNAWQACNTDFLAGRTAMIWTSTAFLRYLEDNASFPVLAAPLPRGRRAFVPSGGTFFVRPRGAPQASAAAANAFLRFMMEPAQANAWATRTGYLPVSAKGRAQLERDGHYERHPNDRVALTQLDHLGAWPWSPSLFRLQREVVQPRLEAAVLLRRDASSTLAEARSEGGLP